MIGFLPDAIKDVKAIEDLRCTRLDAICMAGSDACIAFVDHTGLDAATSHPQSGHEAEVNNSARGQMGIVSVCLPSGTSANDQSAIATA